MLKDGEALKTLYKIHIKITYIFRNVAYVESDVNEYEQIMFIYFLNKDSTKDKEEWIKDKYIFQGKIAVLSLNTQLRYWNQTKEQNI